MKLLIKYNYGEVKKNVIIYFSSIEFCLFNFGVIVIFFRKINNDKNNL